MTPADRLLIFISATSIGFFAYLTWAPSYFADRFELTTPLEKKIISLDKDQDLSIHGALGDSRIRINNHRVRFIDSPCSAKFCVHQGWARHNGELRACLPNKISLRLIGQATRFDSITF